MHKLIIISGPTASSKSHLAEIIAEQYDSVIINADSMQVYKELPILTAQPQDLTEKKLYSVLSYKDYCSAGIWTDLARREISQAQANTKMPIVVGGTGLYVKSLLYGLAPIPNIAPSVRLHVRDEFAKLGKDLFFKLLAEKDPKIIENVRARDSNRMIRAMEVLEQTGRSIIDFKIESKPIYKDFLHLNLVPERKFLYDNCNARFATMIKNGAIEEVLNFRFHVDESHPLSKAIGFREISSYLDGKISLTEATEKSQQATRNYAKRQLTWFRNQEQNAITLEFTSISELEKQVRKILF